MSTLVAKQSEATLRQENDQISLTYLHDGISLTVYLNCIDADGDIINGRQDVREKISITLQSRCCCPGKCQFSNDNFITGGAIFLILLVALLAVYLVGGVIFLKVSRGATGSDLIPNRSLWFNVILCTIEGLRYSIRVVRYRSFSVEYQKA